MKTCFETTIGGIPIKLHQTARDTFATVYGKQIKTGLRYGDAAAELGASIMHALACEGKLDNREKGET